MQDQPSVFRKTDHGWELKTASPQQTETNTGLEVAGVLQRKTGVRLVIFPD